MTARTYSPKRRLRSELLPLVLVLSVPVALYLAFPSGAVGFRCSEGRPVKSSDNSFVVLSSKSEEWLLSSARASWQTDAASRRGVRANLLSCRFSESAIRVASGLRPSVGTRVNDIVEYEIDVIPDGVAAGLPTVLPPEEPVRSSPAFSKSDLLQLK